MEGLKSYKQFVDDQVFATGASWEYMPKLDGYDA